MFVAIWFGLLKFLSVIAEMIFYAIVVLVMVLVVAMFGIGIFALLSQL